MNGTQGVLVGCILGVLACLSVWHVVERGRRSRGSTLEGGGDLNVDIDELLGEVTTQAPTTQAPSPLPPQRPAAAVAGEAAAAAPPGVVLTPHPPVSARGEREGTLRVDVAPAPYPRWQWDVLGKDGTPARQRCSRAWLDYAMFTEGVANVTFAGADQEHYRDPSLAGSGGRTLVCLMEPSPFAAARPKSVQWWTEGMGPRQRGPCRQIGRRMKACSKGSHGGPSWNQMTGAALVTGPSADINDTLCKPSMPCVYITMAAMDFSNRNVPPSTLLRPLRELVLQPKTKEVAFMFSNRGGAGMYWMAYTRWEFRDELAKVMNVTRPVGHDRDYGGKSTRGASLCQNNEAVELYRPYTFSVAFENADSPLWVTERIVNSFLAGTIPIYWGSQEVTRYFNPKAFINAWDHINPNRTGWDKLAAYVKRVYENKTLLDEYFAQPPCTEESLRRLMWWRKGSNWAGFSGPLEPLGC
eukprot:Hpha_TRINITY_DN15418_c0_g1::TRINITY_DN15418_c0_g1_i1::g.174992::m.174992